MFEEHHEAKQLLRDYLAETLNDPDSFDEIDWVVMDVYDFKTNKDGFIEKDWEKIVDKENNERFNKLVSLDFRANNSFGAKVKERKYALYLYDNDGSSIFVDDYIYSNKLGINKGENNSTSVEHMFLWNYYFTINNGTKTPDDFYNRYPKLNRSFY
ncbi:hypothetical protein [Sinomicrobium oceani]|nr:hypothetical protein [Sinomicrobium oceani]